MPAVAKPLVDVSAQAAYPTNPQVEFTFNPTKILIGLEDDPAVLKGCAVSFDGVNDAGFLITGDYAESKSWTGPYRRIWLKKYTAVGASMVRVEVE
jgi:hypothetical protein